MLRFVRSLAVLAAFAVAPADLAAEPMRQPEILYNRPSGFWTSNRPAEGGAYRWRLLAIGGGIAAITGFLLVRAIRKASAERAARG
jgi:hypothetical protein